jgi:hypothetical protein
MDAAEAETIERHRQQLLVEMNRVASRKKSVNHRQQEQE